MTEVRGKPAMLAVYCDNVKRIEWKLRRIRQDIAKSGRTSHAQWRERLRLAAQATMLYELRCTARAFARARIEARREVEGERKVPRRIDPTGVSA